MKRIFILEDDPARITAFKFAIDGKAEVTVAQWVHGQYGAIESYKPPYDLLLLDHDLGGQTFVDSSEENTGAGFVRWLGKAPETDRPDIIIHSWNPDGGRAMARELVQNGWTNVVRFAFDAKLLEWLQGYGSHQ